MFFPGTSIIYVFENSVFMFLKVCVNNTLIEKNVSNKCRDPDCFCNLQSNLKSKV